MKKMVSQSGSHSFWGGLSISFVIVCHPPVPGLEDRHWVRYAHKRHLFCFCVPYYCWYTAYQQGPLLRRKKLQRHFPYLPNLLVSFTWSYFLISNPCFVSTKLKKYNGLEPMLQGIEFHDNISINILIFFISFPAPWSLSFHSLPCWDVPPTSRSYWFLSAMSS